MNTPSAGRQTRATSSEENFRFPETMLKAERAVGSRRFLPSAVGPKRNLPPGILTTRTVRHSYNLPRSRLRRILLLSSSYYIQPELLYCSLSVTRPSSGRCVLIVLMGALRESSECSKLVELLRKTVNTTLKLS